MKCIKCRTESVRIHATIHTIGRRRRFWLFGPWIYPRRTIGFDLSCTQCLFAWTVIDGDIVEAPLQPAHEMLKQQVASKPKEPTVTPIQTYDQDLAIDPRDEEVRRQRRRAALKT